MIRFSQFTLAELGPAARQTLVEQPDLQDLLVPPLQAAGFSV